MKISAVYKITNTATGDFYIGSSKDVKSRWAAHKCPSTWKQHQNNQMYHDMKKYSIDKFAFEILADVEEGSLKEKEQQFIETLHPTYNSNRANGWDIERYKEHYKDYEQSDKRKESLKKARNKYQNQLCCYNGETLTLHALVQRFVKAGIENPTKKAKKYIIPQSI